MNNIYLKIPKIMQDIGAVPKDSTNNYDKYKFRSIDAVYNALQPALAKNGVFIVPKLLESSESVLMSSAGKEQIRVKVKVEYELWADDGSKVTAIFSGEGVDRSDKATNKAFQASFKYMLTQLFCIAYEGQEDPDAESPDITPHLKKESEIKKNVIEKKPLVNFAPISVSDQKALFELAEKTGYVVKELRDLIKSKYGIEKSSALNMSQLDELKAILNEKGQ